ncbi:MAG: hypothetical protein U5N86_10690 [Planctomycetota bacterium]|nr:hypothetical protein [Planctomycetota bacterium]
MAKHLGVDFERPLKELETRIDESEHGSPRSARLSTPDGNSHP